MGRITTATTLDPQAQGGATVRKETYTYDSTYLGFVASQTINMLMLASDPLWCRDLVTQFVPDSKGRIHQKITDPGSLALTTTLAYDANNNILTSADPRGNTTSFTYDTEDRLTQITYPSINSVVATKTLVYDANGNKAVEYDENGVGTFYKYDVFGRLSAQIRDMVGSGTFDAVHDTYSGLNGSANLTSLFTYNNVNSKLTAQDPNGNVTSYVYDALQRPLSSTLTGVSDPVQTRTTQYFYDAGHNTGFGIFDSAGYRPNRVIDPLGYETDMTYDALCPHHGQSRPL